MSKRPTSAANRRPEFEPILWFQIYTLWKAGKN